MDKLKSRKLVVAVMSALFIVLTDGFGVDLQPETYWSLIAVASAYIFGQSYVDAKK